ncbi:Amidohydrolase 3 [Alkaliphilus metalliredigens QYMF]|uniref:Amidohydrolase 3 n=1 Tax=Alkaliphilus metalliredigens (strain QYMF) TaxID=293826 RepID=A6TSP3_ALKMQ|nr:amidohydrolase [Alkaliphilus metalliredigens]ABR49211.1 Amidohydrolase 3 [Alkaliphilus metalliredigens QYMF]
MKKQIFMNGKVMTMNQEQKECEAFIVEGEHIIKTGSNEEILAFQKDKIKIVDLRGKRVIPGLNDSHMHLLGYALSNKKVDLTHCRSLEEIAQAINRYIENEDDQYFGEWIIGHGWNHENFQVPQLPTAVFLDEISQERPILLSRACYHIGVMNHKALEMVGFSQETENPEGGHIDRLPNSEKPMGIVRESALYHAHDFIPGPEDVMQIQDLILDACQDAVKVGLTSIQSDDFGAVKSPNTVLEAYGNLEKSGALKVRMNLQMLLPTLDKLQRFIKTTGIHSQMGSERLKYGPIKILADGSLGSRTAALERPYSDDEETQGVLVYGDAQLEEILRYGKSQGMQLAIHGIGDRTMNQILGIVEGIFQKDEINHRSRIIHCQITDHAIIDKMAKLHVIADIQPGFMPTDMKIVERRVGRDRVKESYNWKTMLEGGVPVAGSSDSPVEPFNPFLGIYSAVTRRNFDGEPKAGWYPEQRLTVEEAIGIYTLGSSYATFEENSKGKIQEGYLADFIVLDRDIQTIPPQEIKGVTVEATYIGGECVYSHEETRQK